MALYNLDYEKQFLSAAIKTPEILAECPHTDEFDFSPTNRPVFRTLKVSVTIGGTYSPFVLIERLNSLNVKIADTIEPSIYINSLLLQDVDPKAAIGISRELSRIRIRREMHEVGVKIQQLSANDIEPGEKEPLKAAELVAKATEIFNKQINLFSGGKEDEPKDLYSTMDDFLERENTFEKGSLASPFSIYNDMYGQFDPESIYCWIARMKVGKSSYAMSMFQQMALADKDDSFRALVLDTEMSTEEVQSRIISSLSGVKEYYIRHKLYKKQPHMKQKVEKACDLMSPLWGKIEHIYIGGKDLAYQLSAARRWAFKKLKDGHRGILALDYFKMNSSADFRSRTSRDIVIGEKVDAYKNLIKELKIPLIAFGQANREGEDSKAGVKMQNSSVIAGSDMIAAFCSNIYLLEKLSPEQRGWLNQMAADGATHSLKLIAPRQLGPNEMGKDVLVKYKDSRGKERWCENYMLLSFNNFVFKEVGTFQDVYERNKTAIQVQPIIVDQVGDQLL